MFCYKLELFKNTSDYLNNVNAEMAESLTLILLIKTVFQSMRDNNSKISISFNELYLEATNISKENNIIIPIQKSNKNHRIKKIPEKFRQFMLYFYRKKFFRKTEMHLKL